MERLERLYLTEIRADSHRDCYSYLACNESGEPPAGARTALDADGEASLIEVTPTTGFVGLSAGDVARSIYGASTNVEMIEVEVYYTSEFISTVMANIFSEEEEPIQWFVTYTKPREPKEKKPQGTTNLLDYEKDDSQHPDFDRYDYYRVQVSYQGESWYGFLDKGIEFPASIEADYPFIVSLGEEDSAEIFAEFGDSAPLVFTSDDC